MIFLKSLEIFKNTLEFYISGDNYMSALNYWFLNSYHFQGDRSGRDPVVVGLITTYAISAYHHYRCKFEFCSWRGILDTILRDKVCQ